MHGSSGQNVVHLSDQAQGGAAIAGNRIALSLAQAGVRVERWFCCPEIFPRLKIPQVALEPNRKRPWYERLIRNFSRPVAARLRHRRHERLLENAVFSRNPVLLHLHNLHASGLTHSSLLSLPPDLPLVWTLHDCWPIKPQPYETEGDTRPKAAAMKSAAAFERAQFFAARPKTVLVAPSNWIAGQARAVVPPTLRVEVMPYGVPADIFRPLAKIQVRRELGLPEQCVLVGFAAVGVDPRKGADIFEAALAQVEAPGVSAVTWGGDSQDRGTRQGSHAFGMVVDEQRLAQLYAACDIFVCPSRMDNMPNTVLESLACGTPVVGSNAGGIPEMVRSGETGWLFESGSIESCAAALRSALDSRNQWPAYHERCRTAALGRFSMEAQGRAYRLIYESLLTKGRANQLME